MPRRKQTRKRKINRCGGGMTMELDRVVDNDEYRINPSVFYYLKLGNYYYFDDDDEEVVFEQNGQYYKIDPRSAVIFKGKI